MSSSPVSVVVFVHRGLVQDVVADSDDVRVMVVDYDNEAVSGGIEREFAPVPCDAELITKACNRVERP